MVLKTQWNARCVQIDFKKIKRNWHLLQVLGANNSHYSLSMEVWKCSPYNRTHRALKLKATGLRDWGEEVQMSIKGLQITNDKWFATCLEVSETNMRTDQFNVLNVHQHIGRFLWGQGRPFTFKNKVEGVKTLNVEPQSPDKLYNWPWQLISAGNRRQQPSTELTAVYLGENAFRLK